MTVEPEPHARAEIDRLVEVRLSPAQILGIKNPGRFLAAKDDHHAGAILENLRPEIVRGIKLAQKFGGRTTFHKRKRGLVTVLCPN